MAKVFLNFGHGGKDCGAVGCDGKTYERDLNKNIGGRIARILKAEGHSVKVFQQTNSLLEVIKAENAGSYDLAVSIHCNAAEDPAANGTETLYFENSIDGKVAASIVQDALVDGLELKNRGIKPRADLGFLRKTKAPAVLIELAFISNEKEENLLIKKPGKFAKATAAAIDAVLKLFEWRA